MTMFTIANHHPLSFMTLAAFLLTSCWGQQLCAQQMGVCCDTELQTDFKGRSNCLNLLRLSADYPLGEHFKLNAATISISKTRRESLLDDLQGFSNIEAHSTLLTLAVAGIGWELTDRHSLFCGVRNVNEDYFTSPVTSFFLNSSCGIFPTLACNMDIANYPLASIGLHYSYSAPSFCLQASVYNGQAYDQWAGRDNLWRVAPHSDGLFLITQGDWLRGRGHYFAGAALHTGAQGASSARSTLWAYTEQALTDRLTLIADVSQALGHSSVCTAFAGIGAQYAWRKTALGLFADYVRFRQDSEWVSELTYRYELSSILAFCTSCQLIHHGSWMPVGMVRMSIRI